MATPAAEERGRSALCANRVCELANRPPVSYVNGALV
jgi:hypothetical protein